jgi:hypothetical protein
VRSTTAGLEKHGRIENSDDFPFYDRIISAWQRLGHPMIGDFGGLDL